MFYTWSCPAQGGTSKSSIFPLIFHDINHPASLGYPHLSHPKLEVFVLKRISLRGSPMTMETLNVIHIYIYSILEHFSIETYMVWGIPWLWKPHVYCGKLYGSFMVNGKCYIDINGIGWYWYMFYILFNMFIYMEVS